MDVDITIIIKPKSVDATRLISMISALKGDSELHITPAAKIPAPSWQEFPDETTPGKTAEPKEKTKKEKRAKELLYPLPDDTKSKILGLAGNGLRPKDIAKKLNLPARRVNGIIRGNELKARRIKSKNELSGIVIEPGPNDIVGFGPYPPTVRGGKISDEKPQDLRDRITEMYSKMTCREIAAALKNEGIDISPSDVFGLVKKPAPPTDESSTETIVSLSDEIKTRIIELLTENYTANGVSDVIFEETGLVVSPAEIRYFQLEKDKGNA